VAFSAQRPQFIPKAVHMHKMRPEQIIVIVLPLSGEGQAMGPLEAVFAQRLSPHPKRLIN